MLLPWWGRWVTLWNNGCVNFFHYGNHIMAYIYLITSRYMLQIYTGNVSNKQIYCPFLIELFVFLWLSCESSLAVLGISPLWRYMTFKYFLPLCGLSFHFLDGSLWTIENKIDFLGISSYYLLIYVLLAGHMVREIIRLEKYFFFFFWMASSGGVTFLYLFLPKLINLYSY